MRFFLSFVSLFLVSLFSSVSVHGQFLPATAGPNIPLVNLASALSQNVQNVSTYASVLLYNVAAGKALAIQTNAGQQGQFVFEALSVAASDSHANFVLGAAVCASCSTCAPLSRSLIASPLSTQAVQIQGLTSVECSGTINTRILQNWGGGDALGQSVNNVCSVTTHVGENEAYFFVPTALDGDNIVYQIRAWSHQFCVSAPVTSSAFSLQLVRCSSTDTTQQWAIYGN